MSTSITFSVRPDAPPACHGHALLGAALWLLGILVLMPGWAPALLLLSPLVLVPLTLALLAPQPGDDGLSSRLWRTAAGLQLPAALILLGAFVVPPGPLAAAFTLPWLAYTALVALLGLARLRASRGHGIAELGIDAGLIFLAIGGMWVFLSRAGIRPLGFNEPIVLLTGVHFHYAGLVLPLLTGLAAREWKGMTARVAVLAVTAGVPLVALGINLAPLGLREVEWLASLFLASAALLTAFLQLRAALASRVLAARLLLLVSALALVVGMVLAALYATSTYWERNWLDIPVMIRSHGILNALGFALLGLLGWNVIGRPAAG